MKLYIGNYFLACLSEADWEGREREGYHVEYANRARYYLCPYGDLERAKRMLLDELPEPCRAFATWEGEL